MYQSDSSIINKASAASGTTVSGLAERLSLAGADVGIGVTNLLADLGPASTQSVSTLRDTLREITRNFPSFGSFSSTTVGLSTKAVVLSEEAVARLIFFFSERGSRKQTKDNSDSSTLVGTLTNDFEIGEGSEWKLSNVAEVLKEDYATLNWISVAQKFDFPDFFVRDAAHLISFMNLFRASATIVFPFSVIVGSAWKNQLGQLSLLENILNVPPNVFDIPLTESELADAATAAPGPSSWNPKGWASIIILQCLLQMSETTSLFPRVRDLFVKGILSYPEVLLCALVRTQLNIGNATYSWPSTSAGMQLKGQVMRELIPLFFKPNAKCRVQNGPAAIRRLWAISAGTVEAACIESWRSTVNETSNSRLKTLNHIIGIIRLLPSMESATMTILNSNKDIEFTIALAFALADQSMLNLRSWLNDRVISGGFVFFMSLSTYVSAFQKFALPRSSSNDSEGSGTTLISTENLGITLSFLQSLDKAILEREIPGSINKQTIGDFVKALKENILSSHPTISASENEEDIEEMANSYFQKIYSSEQSIDEVVEMLKRFKVSGTARENDIFTCMIHNLFDEYRFFSKYPEKELRITGILFGKLIQHQLVTSITLGIALRYVLEALRKPPGPPGNTTSNQGKMFRFGMFALEQFKDRLHEWPQYCSHIVMIPYLKEGYADLVKEIEQCVASDNATKSIQPGSSSLANSDSVSISSDRSSQKAVTEHGVPSSVDVRTSASSPIESGTGVVGQPYSSSKPPLSSGGQTSSYSSSDMITPVKSAQTPQRTSASFGPGLGRAVNLSDDYHHEEPPSMILDRVQFLINNVTMSNVEAKAQELKDMLDSRHFGWLGNYLVVKRISTQPNFHSVYLSFLDQLGDYGKGLVDAILSSVYLNIGKLLRSPKITVSTSERSLLKNLGSFLGQITLARNKPVLQIMLDCKELLFQGYETGMLIAVTPFVAKILEGSKNSVVFKPPNPWIMGLLSVFRALYGVEDLKMNIKFEVEVLCKNLGIKLEDIPIRSNELSMRVPPNKLKNPDFNIKSASGTSSTTNPSTASSASVVSTPDAKQSLPTADVTPASSGATAISSNILPNASTMTLQNSQDQNTMIPNLASYVTVNPSLIQLFQKFPVGHAMMNVTNVILKKTVPLSVDRAIREIIQPVVERSVTIACITTKEIITKDFAMESDENKMRAAAHLMVSNMAGSLALVTCKEPLRTSISSNLRQLLVSTITASQTASVQLNEQEQSILDQCVAMCATDNLELGCMLIEKAAMEKAIRDVDEALASAFTKRIKHREQSGQPFYDVSIFASGNQKYPAALPEPLRPKPGWLRNEHLSIYEAFQRVNRPPVLSSTQTTTTSDRISPGLSSSVGLANDSSLPKNPKLNMDALASLVIKLDTAISSCLLSVGSRASEITMSMLPADHEIKQMLAATKQLMNSVAASGSITTAETESLLGFAQNIFKRLYELRLSEPLRIEGFISILESINECCRQLGQDLGTWATYAPTETDNQRKLHRTILLLLMRSRLVPASEIDDYLSKSIDGGRNMAWVEFTSLFLRTAVLENLAQPKDFSKTMTILVKVGSSSGQNNPATQLLRFLEEMAYINMGELKGRMTPDIVPSSFSTLVTVPPVQDRPTFQQSSCISAASLANFVVATKRAEESIDALSKNDPVSLQQQVMILLDGWMRIINDLYAHEKSIQYIQLLQQNGVGKNEEQTERFFRSSAELLVEAVLKSASIDMAAGKDSKQNYTKVLNYAVIDAFGKLICLMIRQVGNGTRNDQVSQQQISLLNQVLGIIIRTMMANYERFKKENGGAPLNWDQRPWFRLLLNLLMDLNAPSPALDPINFGIVSVFGAAFHIIQPLVIPGFAFAWLELISHRMFLTNLLMAKGQKGWALAHQLLIDLFLFLEPHLHKIEMTEAIKSLYKGTLRVLLVLLHDFPSFLAGYHLSFCNVIPENCIQVRNLILSAFPRGMVLPDPFTPNLKIDLLPEISKSPVILSNVVAPLVLLRSDIESYLKSRQPIDFIHGLLPRLCKEGSKDIDALKVNALVLFIGIQAISRLQSSQFSHSLAHSPEMEILQKLMDLNDRGRYISLNAIANQLRYPSSHTHYFSCVMLFLFSESRDEAVREQITRVLLERLIVHRPHPWGLLITFIELIKNQRYQFWSHSFTHCAAEIEKVFESVARSCMTPGVRTGVGESSQ